MKIDMKGRGGCQRTDKCFLRFSTLFLVGLTCFIQTTCTATDVDENKQLNIVSEMVDWLRANGAFINPKAEVRRAIAGDPASPLGVFATETLQEGELVCSIPWEVILKPRDPKHDEWDCGTVEATFDAMNSSNPSPYGKYLLSQPRGYLPAFWSQQGQELFSELLGSDAQLPPYRIQDALKVDWADYCEGGADKLKDPMQLHARMLVLARADYQYMIPWYDLFNHDNAKYNLAHKFSYEQLAEEQKGVEIVTTKVIQPGEQLYNSYNRCTICWDRKDWFGTPEMLERYGFVESMPQFWLFAAPRIKFELDWKDKNESTGELEVDFLVPLSQRGVEFLRNGLNRLETLGEQKKNAAVMADADIPKSEWDIIWQYHDALMVAMKAALDSDVETTEEVWGQSIHWWVSDGNLPPEDDDNYYYEPDSNESEL